MERTWIVRRTTEVVVTAESATGAIAAARQLHEDQAVVVEISATAQRPSAGKVHEVGAPGWSVADLD
jgi:hypothetical protein